MRLGSYKLWDTENRRAILADDARRLFLSLVLKLFTSCRAARRRDMSDAVSAVRE